MWYAQKKKRGMGWYLKGGLEVLARHGLAARVGLLGGRLTVRSRAALNPRK